MSSGVSFARDRYGVRLRFAEEVTQADTIGVADFVERVERGHHMVGLKLREQRSGVAGVGGEACEGELLRGAERAEFQADGIDGERVKVRSRYSHTTMLAGF